MASAIKLSVRETTLVKDALTAGAAAAAVLAIVGPSTCQRFSYSLIRDCRNLPYELPVPYELLPVMHRLADPLCDTLAEGHWALFVIVAANAACYVPALGNSLEWGVSRQLLSHERLLSYQLAHSGLPHIVGNMLTLLKVGPEVSSALGCNQLLLLALYVVCGWAGGFAAALLSDKRTVGASGSVSGVIVALSVLRPGQAVPILGKHYAANPLLLLLGTFARDLERNLTRGPRKISWQCHLGGGAAGCVLAWLLSALGLA